MAYGAEFIGLSPKKGEDQKGIVKMQTAAKSNLVLTEFPSLSWLAELQKQTSHAEFYQHIAKGLIKGTYTKQIFTELGNSLIALAEHAYRLRLLDVVEQSSQLLLNLPLSSKYRSVGHFYEASCLHRKGHLEEERALLGRMAEKFPKNFRAKALTALSASYLVSGDYQSSLSLCVEAGRAAACYGLFDSQSFIISQRHIAVIKSINGDHRGALADLERMLPLVRVLSRWQPYLFYEQLNSYAVELGEVGRLVEARNICKIVLASPYASAYPEWRETCNELELRGYRTPRSFVPVTQRASNTENVLPMPVPEPDAGTVESEPEQSGQPARILDYVEWINNMAKESNGEKQDEVIPQDLEAMTDQDMIVKIVQLSSQSGLDRATLRKILDYVIQTTSEPRKKS